VSERPSQAVAEGTEKAVNEIPGFRNLHLEPVDALVILAIAAAITALIVLRSRGLGPVAVSATEVRTDKDGATTESPRSDIAAIVTDRLARVDLHPPSAVPSVSEDVEGVLSPFESTPAKAAQAAARLAEMLRREKGFRVKLLLRTSDTTTRRGATFELVDLGRARVLVAGTVFAATYQEAARQAAFRIAAVLLRRLPRRQVRGRWNEWDPSGTSLHAYEDAGWTIKLRQYDQAIAHLRTGLEVDPANLLIRLRLGTTFERVDDHREALWTYFPAVSRNFPPDPAHAATREAALCRWRTAIVLSNGHRWGPAWLLDALEPGTPGAHTIEKRLRAFLEDRYKKALGSEYATICKTVLADHIERGEALEHGQPHLPQLEVVDRWRAGRLRLVGDKGPGQTLEAIVLQLEVLARQLLSVIWIAAAARAVLYVDRPNDVRVARVCGLVEHALEAVSASTDPVVLDAAEALGRALPAVSIRHFFWRCAEHEADSIRWRQRRVGHISRADVKTLRIGMEERFASGLLRFPIYGEIASLPEQHRQSVERQARDAAPPIFGLQDRLGPRRAQLAYNLACSLAVALPPRGQQRLADWQRATHERVDAIVHHLHQATTGPGNLVEQGALDWIVYEDPDLQEVRQHARFCRWAAGVLQRDVKGEAPSEPSSTIYVRSLLEYSARVARQSWAVDGQLDRTSALDLLRKEKQLCTSLAKVLEAPRSPEARAEVFAVAFAMHPAVDDTPRWPTAEDATPPDGTPARPARALRQALSEQAAVATAEAADLERAIERGDAPIVRPIALRHVEAWRSLGKDLTGVKFDGANTTLA
jgi:hypothetical protein